MHVTAWYSPSFTEVWVDGVVNEEGHTPIYIELRCNNDGLEKFIWSIPASVWHQSTRKLTYHMVRGLKLSRIACQMADRYLVT